MTITTSKTLLLLLSTFALANCDPDMATKVHFQEPAVHMSTSGAVAAPIYAPQTTSNQGQWRTLANGCSYSRAQAPGYAPTWVLIQNPHHIGQPNVGAHCENMLSGS